MRGLSPSFSGLSDDDLKRKVRYTTISRPAAIEQELGYALPHVFNHQTHHRGQVHALLTKITGDAPSATRSSLFIRVSPSWLKKFSRAPQKWPITRR